MSNDREQLFQVLVELSSEASDLRFGQLIANLATLAVGATPEAIWDAEDQDMLRAARRLLDYYQQRGSTVA